MFDFSNFDFSDFGSMFGDGGFDFSSMGSIAGEGGGGSWDYWIKAIQDAVIGQSAGYDAVTQNEENTPLARQARGEDPNLDEDDGTKGEYVYNLENDMPFLNSMYDTFADNKNSDPYLTSIDTSRLVSTAQNNASGSNASLDKSLDEDARKILGVSEGGAKPQMKGTTSEMGFNSMMDSFGGMELPLDNPKSRKEILGSNDGGLSSLFGSEKGQNDDSWFNWFNWFGG